VLLDADDKGAPVEGFARLVLEQRGAVACELVLRDVGRVVDDGIDRVVETEPGEPGEEVALGDDDAIGSTHVFDVAARERDAGVRKIARPGASARQMARDRACEVPGPAAHVDHPRRGAGSKRIERRIAEELGFLSGTRARSAAISSTPMNTSRPIT